MILSQHLEIKYLLKNSLFGTSLILFQPTNHNPLLLAAAPFPTAEYFLLIWKAKRPPLKAYFFMWDTEIIESQMWGGGGANAFVYCEERTQMA